MRKRGVRVQAEWRGLSVKYQPRGFMQGEDKFWIFSLRRVDSELMNQTMG
jgi:hypothetical protein